MNQVLGCSLDDLVLCVTSVPSPQQYLWRRYLVLIDGSKSRTCLVCLCRTDRMDIQSALWVNDSVHVLPLGIHFIP
jgi:hypothetical protein